MTATTKAAIAEFEAKYEIEYAVCARTARWLSRKSGRPVSVNDYLNWRGRTEVLNHAAHTRTERAIHAVIGRALTEELEGNCYQAAEVIEWLSGDGLRGIRGLLSPIPLRTLRKWRLEIDAGRHPRPTNYHYKLRRAKRMWANLTEKDRENDIPYMKGERILVFFGRTSSSESGRCIISQVDTKPLVGTVVDNWSNHIKFRVGTARRYQLLDVDVACNNVRLPKPKGSTLWKQVAINLLDPKGSERYMIDQARKRYPKIKIAVLSTDHSPRGLPVLEQSK